MQVGQGDVHQRIEKGARNRMVESNQLTISDLAISVCECVHVCVCVCAWGGECSRDLGGEEWEGGWADVWEGVCS